MKERTDGRTAQKRNVFAATVGRRHKNREPLADVESKNLPEPDISQGSAATHLRRGGIFYHHRIAILRPNLTTENGQHSAKL